MSKNKAIITIHTWTITGNARINNITFINFIFFRFCKYISFFYYAILSLLLGKTSMGSLQCDKLTIDNSSVQHPDYNSLTKATRRLCRWCSKYCHCCCTRSLATSSGLVSTYLKPSCINPGRISSKSNALAPSP